MTPTNF
jgi:hypothetical protein